MENEHPVLSRIGPWMRDRMREAEANFIDECEWSAHEEALSLCSLQNLQQTVYFLNRDLTFMREVQKQLFFSFFYSTNLSGGLFSEIFHKGPKL